MRRFSPFTRRNRSSTASTLPKISDLEPSQVRREAGAGGCESPAELYRTLGSLSLLADDLSELLPDLCGQLEDALLAGRVRHRAADAQEACDAVASAAHSISVARFTAFLVGQEVQKAQTAIRDLAAA
ncbi:hypothetical protein [Amycolatopsis sp. NPDC004079]|uniref:hypothetical protein n=1 Tax=Amycolatopsis sp. NPDC004079 TaxID=3154549 RepID=UPI0033AAC387